MYHKAECTCLCVPAHLLKLHSGGPTATSSGLLLSEDEGDDECTPPWPHSRTPGGYPGLHSPPTHPRAPPQTCTCATCACFRSMHAALGTSMYMFNITYCIGSSEHNACMQDNGLCSVT